MGVVGFVLSGGGTAGVLLGGILTDVLSWHWIFLVNIPVGVAVFALCRRLLPADSPDEGGRPRHRRRRDGDVIAHPGRLRDRERNQEGWTSAQTLACLPELPCCSSLRLDRGANEQPLVPLGLFRIGNVASANVTGVLLAAAMFAWFFLSALYLQRVLGYSPLEVGFAFLPATLIWGASSLFLSDTAGSCDSASRLRCSWDWRSTQSCSCSSRARQLTGTTSWTSCPGCC
jgi:predicted MFS family arabinose efflux permease